MHDDTLSILYPEDNSLRPVKVKSDEESTELSVPNVNRTRSERFEHLSNNGFGVEHA